jgi:nicotinamide-nucleotide amidase
MKSNNLLEIQTGELLIQKGLKLVLAESCTGGLISHRITNVAGSSEYFLGSMVSYSYEAKEEWLGVRHSTLSIYGAVSREMVLEMAHGARDSLKKHFPIDNVIGLSVSGIAGPGGGIPGKPVGMVWIGLSAEGKEDAWQFQWKGNREENKGQSAQKALEILLEYLKTIH